MDIQIDFSTREGRRTQGKLIQQATEEAGISLESLAREIGCSRALIYQYVSGATLAQSDRLQAIAECTGKPLLFFFGAVATPNHVEDRILSLQTLLEAQMSSPDLQGALTTCEQLVALARQASDARAEAAAHVRSITILLQQGNATRALSMLDKAIPFLQQHEFTRYLHIAEHNRGYALLSLGRVEEAEAIFTDVIAKGGWTARWQGLVSLVAVAEHRGQYARALALLDEALAMGETAPDERAAQTLCLYASGNLANVHLACGDYPAALDTAGVAQDLAVKLANRGQYIESLLTQGVCRRLSGSLSQSRQALESALRWARLAEDNGREALAWAELAMTLSEMGRFDEARLRGKDALQQAIATGTRRAELAAQLALSHACLRSGELQEAEYHAVQSWEISVQLSQPYAQATALIALGDAQAARGEDEQARKAFIPAYDLAGSIGARLPAMQAALGMARLDDAVNLDSLLTQMRDLMVPEVRWQVLLQCGIRQELEQHFAEAEQSLREAIDVLTELRQSLNEEAAGDTYLEYRRAWEPYLRLARLYRLRGLTEDVEQIVTRAEWPPLTEELEGVR